MYVRFKKIYFSVKLGYMTESSLIKMWVTIYLLTYKKKKKKKKGTNIYISCWNYKIFLNKNLNFIKIDYKGFLIIKNQSYLKESNSRLICLEKDLKLRLMFRE